MKKFDKVYNNIILECKENKIISEGFFRKATGLFKGKKGKNAMMKDAIVSWMNANKITPNGAENKFAGTLPNGYTIKFTFRASEWNDPESTKIDYAVYLKDAEGNDMTLSNKKGTIDYGYSDVDIKKELASKLKVAMDKKDVAAITSKTDNDKAKAKEEKAAAKAKAKEEKAAAKAKAEKEKAAAKAKAEKQRQAAIAAQAKKDEKELGEDA
jgi:hypothetical protein